MQDLTQCYVALQQRSSGTCWTEEFGTVNKPVGQTRAAGDVRDELLHGLVKQMLGKQSATAAVQQRLDMLAYIVKLRPSVLLQL